MLPRPYLGNISRVYSHKVDQCECEQNEKIFGGEGKSVSEE